MRTALLAWDYPPAPSGLSVAAREIAESLVLAGVDVTVFTMDREGLHEHGGVRVIGCPPRAGGRLARFRLIGGAGHLAAPAAFRSAVLAEHRRRRFDLVEATNWYAPACLLAFSGLPLVTRNSTPAAFSRDMPRTRRDRIDARAADALERLQAHRSAGLISNTADHARRIGLAYGLRAGEQPHAVIGLSLSPETLRRAQAAAWTSPAPGEPLRLLFVGRAEHRKGFDAILAATERLADEGDGLPAFEIRLAGVTQDALPAGLSPSARARIRTLGRLTEDELAVEYERAQAVLAPSRYESFGLVYQEAMAYGRPVIASNEDASARAFVGETGAGSMAERTDGFDLAEAMRPVLLDSGYRESLRRHALIATGRFTRRTLSSETISLYERAIDRFASR